MPIEKCLENYFQGILYTNFIYYIKIKLVKYTLKILVIALRVLLQVLRKEMQNI